MFLIVAFFGLIVESHLFLLSLVRFIVFGATWGPGEVGRCLDGDGLETSQQRGLDDLRYESVAWYSTVFLREQGVFT